MISIPSRGCYRVSAISELNIVSARRPAHARWPALMPTLQNNVELISDADWLRQCAVNGSGRPLPTLANAMVALRFDPSLRDSYAFDEMLQTVVLMKPLSS